MSHLFRSFRIGAVAAVTAAFSLPPTPADPS